MNKEDDFYIKILDYKTKKVKWSHYDVSEFWCSDGNGSCDCNRGLVFGINNDACTSNRFFIIETTITNKKKTLDYSYDLKAIGDFHNDYPIKLVDEVINFLVRENKLSELLTKNK